MILYTHVPSELVFPHDDDLFSNQMIVNINEGQLLVQKVSAHEYRVIRLISSDPMAYLNENYTPGNMISLL